MNLWFMRKMLGNGFRKLAFHPAADRALHVQHQMMGKNNTIFGVKAFAAQVLLCRTWPVMFPYTETAGHQRIAALDGVEPDARRACRQQLRQQSFVLIAHASAVAFSDG